MCQTIMLCTLNIYNEKEKNLVKLAVQIKRLNTENHTILPINWAKLYSIKIKNIYDWEKPVTKLEDDYLTGWTTRILLWEKDSPSLRLNGETNSHSIYYTSIHLCTKKETLLCFSWKLPGICPSQQRCQLRFNYRSNRLFNENGCLELGTC